MKWGSVAPDWTIWSRGAELVPSGDPHQLEYFDIGDLPGHLMKEIEHFFRIYKDLDGARVDIDGRGKARWPCRRSPTP